MTTPQKLEMTADYRAVKVEPGTPYYDEPSKVIPPGWYVLGSSTYDDEPAPDVTLKVESAYDANGDDVTERFARRLAVLLAAAFTEEV